MNITEGGILTLAAEALPGCHWGPRDETKPIFNIAIEDGIQAKHLRLSIIQGLGMTARFKCVDVDLRFSDMARGVDCVIDQIVSGLSLLRAYWFGAEISKGWRKFGRTKR